MTHSPLILDAVRSAAVVHIQAYQKVVERESSHLSVAALTRLAPSEAGEYPSRGRHGQIRNSLLLCANNRNGQ